MKISFVIPCYRSEKTLAGVVSEVKSVLAKRPEVEYEFVLVSDHSPDDVWSVVQRLHAEDPLRVKGLELARNFGQHAALMAGYARTTGDLVFSLDDDGQAPVESVFDMVDDLEAKGADVAYGAYAVKRHSAFRNLGSELNNVMARWLLNQPRDLRPSSFSLVRRFVVEEMLRYREAFPYLLGLHLRTTRNIINVPVKHRERSEGTSGYTFVKLLALWMNGFTAFSVKPLRLATFAGFVCAILGFAYGTWTVVNKLFVHPDAMMGYSSLMSVLLFVGGMVMLILGLIGEYVGRIYICISHSPQYVVCRETT